MRLRRLVLAGLVVVGFPVVLAWALRPPAAASAPDLGGLLIAHRAGLSDAPENSLQAIRAAAAAGADAVELDVRAGPAGPVCAHDADQVEGGAALAAALDEALGLGLMVELDVKTGPLGGRRLTRQVVDLVRERRAHDRVWVSAFHPLTLWYVRRADPRLPVGWPLTHGQAWDGPARWMGASVLEPELSLATPERLARWSERGWVVEVWTVDDVALGQELRAAGVAVVVDSVAPHAR